MEEDKKILKEFMEDYKMAEEVLDGDVIQAIENILNKLQELEKENKELEADLYAANCIISDQIDVIRDLKDIQQQICNEELINQEYCIKKSKIEDKIKEYEETADEDNPDDFIRISALKELLEE